MFNLNSSLEQGNYVIKKIDGDTRCIELLSQLGICCNAVIEVISEGYFPNSLLVEVNDKLILLNSEFRSRIFVEKSKTLRKTMN